MVVLIKLVLLKFLFLIFSALAFGESQWFHSSGNHEGQRFSTFNQIKKNNIMDLNEAWIFRSGKIDKRNVVQATPIFIDNKLIIVDIFGGVYALNPKSGKKLWYTKLNPPAGRRGLTSNKKDEPKIYISSKK